MITLVAFVCIAIAVICFISAEREQRRKWKRIVELRKEIDK